MERITSVFGFNYMATPGLPGGPNKVKPNEQIFLRRGDGIMIPLGTFAEAKERSGYATYRGVSNAFGIDGRNYGDVMSPPVNDNLFVDRVNYSHVLSSAVSDKQLTMHAAHDIMRFLGKKDNVPNYVFRRPPGGRKSKRANKRANKKQRTNRRKGRK